MDVLLINGFISAGFTTCWQCSTMISHLLLPLTLVLSDYNSSYQNYDYSYAYPQDQHPGYKRVFEDLDFTWGFSKSANIF